jgi:hypothetical protein
VQYTNHLPINFGDSHFLPFCLGEFTSRIVNHKHLDGSKGDLGCPSGQPRTPQQRYQRRNIRFIGWSYYQCHAAFFLYGPRFAIGASRGRALLDRLEHFQEKWNPVFRPKMR